MDEQQRQAQKRWLELAERARRSGAAVSTDFLTLAEQDLLSHTGISCDYILWGGYDQAERRLACFNGSAEDAPLLCLEIAPTAPKFAGELGHRDFLGALLNLGLKRELLGDIILQDKRGYLFCLEKAAPLILTELDRVGRTPVQAALCTSPPPAGEEPPLTEIVVASQRLDALIAGVCRLSRGESQSLVAEERVAINGRPISSPAHTPRPGDIISIRGWGRFRYAGVVKTTKKDRQRVAVRMY